MQSWNLHAPVLMYLTCSQINCWHAIHWDSVPPRWRHQMETFSALLVICAGDSPVPVNSPHKGQWRGALMFTLICVRINGWVNNREAGDLRRHRAHYNAITMSEFCSLWILSRYTDRSRVIQVILSQQNFHQNELIFWILFDGSIWYHHASQQTFLNQNIATEAKQPPFCKRHF